MGTVHDPFETLANEPAADLFDALASRPMASVGEPVLSAAAPVVTARLQGFALDDAPLIGGLRQLPAETVAARTAVALRRQDIGATVVVVFENGDVRRPIILGVLQDTLPRMVQPAGGLPADTVVADDERQEITAEREIVLRCGDASITLTRAGKVIIRGNYILSRSTGYNKIKGAAVDIN